MPPRSLCLAPSVQTLKPRWRQQSCSFPRDSAKQGNEACLAWQTQSDKLHFLSDRVKSSSCNKKLTLRNVWAPTSWKHQNKGRLDLWWKLVTSMWLPSHLLILFPMLSTNSLPRSKTANCPCRGHTPHTPLRHPSPWTPQPRLQKFSDLAPRSHSPMEKR
jgi:hypothetical protein